jgi:hypothetical protein
MALSPKYLAGFLDSDGCISFDVRKNSGHYTLRCRVAFKQRQDRADILRLIAHEWGLNLYQDDNSKMIVFTGTKALRFLEHTKNHLVIKRDIAEFVMSWNGKDVDNPKPIKDKLKEIRKQPCSYTRPFPSRGWLAGYIDGDGCIRVMKKGNKFYPRVEIKSWLYDPDGLNLIQKNFGGSINQENNTLCYVLYNPEKLLSYITNHSIIKKSQVDYILGHVRNGTVDETVKSNLSKMKAPASTE